MKIAYKYFKHYSVFSLAILSSGIFIAFSFFYILSDHNYLANWYYSLNDCFYKKDEWDLVYFTEKTKLKANYLNILGLFISSSILIYSVIRLKSNIPSENFYRINFKAKNVLPALVILFTGLILWAISHFLTSPAYDEIFSAVNCAELHPFQTISYYMVPNNHLLFNFINSIFFHGLEDKVLSGRIISLFAFLMFQQIVFHFLKKQVPLTHAILGTIALSITLPTLGFASQARGYMLHLMAGWLMFYGYYLFLKKESNHSLKLMAVGILIGYATLPSFLFSHAGLVIFSIYWQLSRKLFQKSWWKYQIIACSFVFLFYLPALSFSGIESFISNPYVKAEEVTLFQFAESFYNLFPFLMNYGISYLIHENNWLLIILFLSPLFLIFNKNGRHKDIFIFYFILILTTIIITLILKKIPFSRNFIIHYSIIHAIILYSFYIYLKWLMQWLNRRQWSNHVYSIFVIILIVLLLRKFPLHTSEHLYFNNATYIFNVNSRDVQNLPLNKKIGFSDGSFYWYYLAKMDGKMAKQCHNGEEEFIVKRKGEIFPAHNEHQYEILLEFPDDGYEIWKSKAGME